MVSTCYYISTSLYYPMVLVTHKYRLDNDNDDNNDDDDYDEQEDDGNNDDKSVEDSLEKNH